MSIDSSKTILLEKKYLYVRASLGFKLEGTSTEIIPTNNGFYRFYIDNLSKALGNSYVNILYDSKDLAFQSFCSDLYMDELMSSDSSAIEDVVLELKKNTSKIEEFENGVSSALEANHQDNVAISAKIDEFQSGVSSGMASNHSDNVAIHSSITSLYNCFPLYFSSIGIPHVYISSVFSYAEIDNKLFSKFVHCNYDTHISDGVFDMYTLKFLVSSFVTPPIYGSSEIGLCFNFKHSIASNVINSVRKKLYYYFIDLSKNSFIDNSVSDINSSSASFGAISEISALRGSYEFCYFISINRELLQVFSSLCDFKTDIQKWLINSSENNGNITCSVKKYNGLIPCDLGYHDISNFNKGYVSLSFSDCDNFDLDFIKKCDLYFSFTDGTVNSIHLYNNKPHLLNDVVSFTDYPLYEGNTGSRLCGMNLVFTGVSSAS